MELQCRIAIPVIHTLATGHTDFVDIGLVQAVVDRYFAADCYCMLVGIVVGTETGFDSDRVSLADFVHKIALVDHRTVGFDHRTAAGAPKIVDIVMTAVRRIVGRIGDWIYGSQVYTQLEELHQYKYHFDLCANIQTSPADPDVHDQ